MGDPQPFSLESLAYPYWQCFSTSTASLFCDDTEAEPEKMAILVLQTEEQNGRVNEYLSRRALELDTCQDFVRYWNEATLEETHVCVSGLSGSDSIQEQNGHSIPLRTWILDKFKTRKSCTPYVSYCSLDDLKGQCGY